MAKKIEMVKIYNKGKRSWPLEWKDGEEVKKAVCNPSRAVEVPKTVASRMIKNYPNDFLEGEALASASNDVKKVKAENAKLKKDLAAEKEKVAALELQLEELTAPAKEVKEDSKGE